VLIDPINSQMVNFETAFGEMRMEAMLEKPPVPPSGPYIPVRPSTAQEQCYRRLKKGPLRNETKTPILFSERTANAV
jgi:hypothetical protein